MSTANNNDEGAGAADKTVPAAIAVSSDTQQPPTDTDLARVKQEEEWKADLMRLEYEIQTLRNVLTVKIDEASELKRKLGITTMVELKQDLNKGIQTIKESETLQKTGAAFKSFGDFASKKLGDIRNSNTFKSVEEKVGSAYTNVKKRVSGTETLPEESQLSGESPASPTGRLPTTDDSEELTAMLPESGKPKVTVTEKPAV